MDISGNKIENTSLSGAESHKLLIELLSQLDTVEESDIKNLRSAVAAENLKFFDKLSEERKISMALLHKLSEEELRKVFKTLYKPEVPDEYEVGFHKLSGSIGLLISFTNDPKYDFIRSGDYKLTS